MKKVITNAEMDQLIKLSMDSFRDGGMKYCIKMTSIWWFNLLGFVPSRIDRIEGTTFNINR